MENVSLAIILLILQDHVNRVNKTESGAPLLFLAKVSFLFFSFLFFSFLADSFSIDRESTSIFFFSYFFFLFLSKLE